MTEESFDKWKEEEATKYDSEHLLAFDEIERVNGKIDFKAGADAAYNLLTDYSREQELKELRSEIERLKGLIGIAHSEGYDDAVHNIEYDNNLEEAKMAVHCVGCGCAIAEGNDYCAECLCEDDSNY